MLAGTAPHAHAGAGADAETPLRFGILAEDGIRAEGYRPLTEYVARTLGRPVELHPVPGRGELPAMLGRGEIDFAVLPPLAYAEAAFRPKPIVALLACSVRQGKGSYRGYLVTTQAGDVRSVAQLAGRRVAFVHPSSTSGYLYPVQVLRREGVIGPDQEPGDVFEVLFAGSHLEVARAVAEGRADAGAIFDAGIEMASRAGIDAGSFRILARTDPIPHEAMAARATLDPDLRERLRAAVLNVDTRTAQGRDVLRTLSHDVQLNGFVACDPTLFEPIRRTAVWEGTGTPVSKPAPEASPR